jgi:lipopolysaccharide biosynthesis protein
MEIQQFKRCAIFAHYDKHNLIDDYVVTYLTRLREVVDNIIFISDSDVSVNELKKINHLILDNICAKHGEYDFGSYKRGFLLLQEKYPQIFNEIYEVVFANDSCYCVGDFKESFEVAQTKDFDAWALADDYIDFNSSAKHLQSYFFVYRRSVFTEQFFQDFIKNIRKLDKPQIIAEYEKNFATTLIANNKKMGAIFSCSRVNQYMADNLMDLIRELKDFLKKFYRKSAIKKVLVDVFSLYKINHIHSNKYYFLLRMNFPLLKRASMLEENFRQQRLMLHWQEVLKFFNKDDKEILNHLIRIKANYKKVRSKFINFLARK